MSNPLLRNLPAVSTVLAEPAAEALIACYGREAATAAIRRALSERRSAIRGGSVPDISPIGILNDAATALADAALPPIRRVINATGIPLHTNLGRAPLAESAARAAYEAARGYLNLELDLTTGKRSSRQQPLRSLLTELTGAESATVVNNCAAATVLVLRALAAGREVIVSRGQLVEIGGSFRIPEIMAVSGAILREVGTTNITRIADYERALTPQTALLLRVHASNYRIHGFTKSATLAELIALGRKRGIPVVDDIGSGAYLDLSDVGLSGEPLIRESIGAGADVVLCSGDKLLGGPQAGLILGRSALIKSMEADPLMRAFRCDKMTLAALAATLTLYRDRRSVRRTVPIVTMLTTPLEELLRRAEALAAGLRSLAAIESVEIVATTTYAGGGSLPDTPLKSYAVALATRFGSTETARRCRLGSPSVLTRVQEDRVLLDVRALLPGDAEELPKILATCLAEESLPTAPATAERRA